MWVLQWLVQGLAVALVATLAAQLVPSSAPRLRHRFWWLALAAVVALPWMSNMVAPHAVVTTLGAPVRALALEVTAPPSWLWTACVALWGQHDPRCTWSAARGSACAARAEGKRPSAAVADLA